MATPIPENRASFTIDEIVRITGGRLRGSSDASVRGVTTDSRGDLGGKLFVALRGDRFDGHGFVAGAVAGGARAVLVERDATPAGVPTVVVDDTLVALGKLAAAYRARFSGPVVAIAGSAGKTTTRTTVAAALEAVHPGSVHATAGNLNNRIGVPMMLFGLGPEHRVSVLELGTNQRGEVAALVGMVAPSVAVLTLVDVEHAEGLGSLDDIEREEGAVFENSGSEGVAIANLDDPRAARQLARAKGRRIGYGEHAAADYRVVERRAIGLGRSAVVIDRPVSGRRERFEIETAFIARPGALAVAAAVAVADVVAGAPVEAQRLSNALRRSSGEPGRLRPIELADGTVIVDDSYNSNPASVRAAVEAAREMARARSARLLLAIGEMRELGEHSRDEHDGVGALLAESGAAFLAAVCGDARRFLVPAEARGVDAVYCDDAEEALHVLLSRVRAKDVVLVKASRGVRAEKIVEGFIEAKGRAA